MASTTNPVISAAPKATPSPSKPVVQAAVKSASKTANKTASKPAAKPAVKAASKPAAPVSAAPKAQPAVAAQKDASSPAAKKQAPKIVRDSFTMTSDDHELIKLFKRDAIAAGRDQTKKSEVVRAALHGFAALSAAQRAAIIGKMVPIKTGRPSKEA